MRLIGAVLNRTTDQISHSCYVGRNAEKLEGHGKRSHKNYIMKSITECRTVSSSASLTPWPAMILGDQMTSPIEEVRPNPGLTSAGLEDHVFGPSQVS